MGVFALWMQMDSKIDGGLCLYVLSLRIAKSLQSVTPIVADVLNGNMIVLEGPLQFQRLIRRNDGVPGPLNNQCWSAL